MTLVLRYSARSDRGLVRSNNEDSVYAGPRLLALADGMGGHAAGEVASQLVIAALRPLDDDEPRGDLLASLGAAVREGNAAIADEVDENPDLDGMGTTLTAILFSGKRMGLCHIGDSRAYLLRDGELTQITRDDTFVQTLVEEGRISADEAHTHPQRSLIMRALTGQEVDPTLIMRESRPDDRILICSDGLSDVVTEQTLRETLTSVEDHLHCADRLIELALRGGGPDNVTVIVADVIDVEYGQSTPIIGGAAAGVDDDYVPDPRTAAGRAAALRPPKAEPRRPSTLSDTTDDEPAHKPRRRLWWLVGALAVIAVLVGGAFIGRAIINTNYYVGTKDGSVVVFRGLDGNFLGQSMNSEYKMVCVYDLNSDTPSVSLEDPGSNCDTLKVSELNEVARQSLPRRPTDESSSLRDARALAGQIRPLCPVRAPAPAPGAEPTPGQTPDPGSASTPPPSSPPSSAPNQAPPNDVATSDCRER